MTLTTLIKSFLTKVTHSILAISITTVAGVIVVHFTPAIKVPLKNAWNILTKPLLTEKTFKEYAKQREVTDTIINNKLDNIITGVETNNNSINRLNISVKENNKVIGIMKDEQLPNIRDAINKRLEDIEKYSSVDSTTEKKKRKYNINVRKPSE